MLMLWLIIAVSWFHGSSARNSYFISHQRLWKLTFLLQQKVGFSSVKIITKISLLYDWIFNRINVYTSLYSTNLERYLIWVLNTTSKCFVKNFNICLCKSEKMVRKISHAWLNWTKIISEKHFHLSENCYALQEEI